MAGSHQDRSTQLTKICITSRVKCHLRLTASHTNQTSDKPLAFEAPCHRITNQTKTTMKLQVVLPWACVLALTAGAAALYSSNHSKDQEIARLTEASQQADQLRNDLDEATKQAKAQEDQITALRQDREDLLRLRNEVRQLRDEKQQLTTKAAAAETAAQRAQQQSAAMSQAVAQQQQQLQAENQQLRTVVQQQAGVSQQNACINNLRQLDAAKQQWALENNKPPTAVPTERDVIPYLAGQKMPACPSGGQYSLNAVNQEPTCSIPGHVLPK